MKVTNDEMIKFENDLGKLIQKHEIEFRELEKQLFSLRHRLRLYGYDGGQQ